jgi:hypothetical protein
MNKRRIGKQEKKEKEKKNGGVSNFYTCCSPTLQSGQID